MNNLEKRIVSELPTHYKNKTVDIFVEELAKSSGIGKTTLYTKVIKPLVLEYSLKPPPKKKNKSTRGKIVLNTEEISVLTTIFSSKEWPSKNIFYSYLKDNTILGDRLPSKSTVFNLLNRSDIDVSSYSKNANKKQKALSLYNEGCDVTEISRQLGLSDQSIKNYLREFGHSFSQELSSAFQLEVLDYYYQHGTTKAIEKYNIPQSTQVRWRKKWGLPPRYNSNKGRKYTLNQNYFSSIDTEGKAYLAGLIATDGNVHKNVVSIELKLEDRDHLKTVSSLIASDKPIMDTLHLDKRTDTYTKGAKVAFVSRYLAEQLHELGITEKKSTDLSVNLNKIPEILQRHFWRGCIDGDGSLFFNPGISRNVLELYGSNSVVTAFKCYVNKKLNIELGGPWASHSIYRVSCQSKGQSKYVANHLYNDSSIYLPRKAKIARSW